MHPAHQLDSMQRKRIAAQHACDLIETQQQDRCDAIAEAARLYNVQWDHIVTRLRRWNV